MGGLLVFKKRGGGGFEFRGPGESGIFGVGFFAEGDLSEAGKGVRVLFYLSELGIVLGGKGFYAFNLLLCNCEPVLAVIEILYLVCKDTERHRPRADGEEETEKNEP